ncbi:MAG: DUF2283 domain-containing protein [Elusimicrobia bacterium]|nr:DUF2283 domain-containing protein [Elusimicrobiota bacterium]
MKLKYDPDVDALYISFKRGKTQVTTLRLNDDVAIDLGPKENIVGIEILSASENLDFIKKIPKVKLENLQAA